MGKRHLIKKESFILKYLYDSLNVRNKSRGSNFYKRIYSLFDSKPDKIVKTHINKPISKSAFVKMHKNRNLFRVGYIQKTPTKILVGVVVYQGEGVIGRTMKKGNILPSKNYEKNITLFKMTDTDLLIIGNKGRLIRKINKYFSCPFVEENRTVISIDPNTMLKDLLDVKTKDSKIDISRIEYQDIERGKRLRIKAYSDEGTVLNNFLKQNFKGANTKYELTQIIAISFTDYKETALLKVTRLNENQYLLKWKSHNGLSLKISNLYGLKENLDSLLLDSKDDKKLLNDLFRHETLSDYASKNIYNRILKDYADYIYIHNNKVKLNYQNIIAKINNIITASGYEIKYINLTTKCGFYLPMGKKTGQYLKMIRIVKDGKIAQHILLDHEKLYECGNETTIKQFFVFSPFLILDFRKTTNPNFDYLAYNDYIINSGEFLYSLKNDQKRISEILTKLGKDTIEKFELNDHYKVASELLNTIDNFKILNSEQKGKLFESICFIILSKMFITKRLGESLKPDGKFIIDDEKIVYDAKNISTKTSFIKSVTRYGKVKDINYITKEHTKKYIYITTHLDDKEFKEVKEKINMAVPDCTVSAITIDAIKDLVKLYDPRRLDREKLKNKIFSGEITRSLSEKDILIEESILSN